MFALLIGLGVALLVFGAVVLLRYADRPGGSIKLLGLEVSSTGAGLPLIALGVACVVFAVTRSRSDAQLASKVTPQRDTLAVDACSATTFPAMPSDRIARIEVGMQGAQVIGPHQPLATPFGLILTREGVPVAVLRLRLYRGPNSSADIYRVEAAVDAACVPLTGLVNSSRGGDPMVLVNADTLRFHVAGREYNLRVGGEGTIAVSLTESTP